jgi:hypothetical protein
MLELPDILSFWRTQPEALQYEAKYLTVSCKIGKFDMLDSIIENVPGANVNAMSHLVDSKCMYICVIVLDLCMGAV